MKTIESLTGQTLFDIAIQEMGSPEGVWDILELNPELRIDIVIPTGTTVYVPDTLIKPAVVDYYTRNGIKPVSNSGDGVVYIPVNTDIEQIVDYSVQNGPTYFDGVGPFDLNHVKKVRIDYNLSPDLVVNCQLYGSNNGSSWDEISNTQRPLDPWDNACIYDLVDCEYKYVRVYIDTEAVESGGTINKITYTT